MKNRLGWSGLVFLTFFFPTLLFAALVTDISGKYSCTGYDAFYDLKYSGNLTIKHVGNTYQFNWDFGQEGGRYSGTALYDPNEDSVAVMFTNPAYPTEVGVGIYVITKEGTLSGNWVYQGRDQISNETCKKVQ